MTKISSCPFCNNSELVLHPIVVTGGGGADSRYIHCDTCGADGPQSFSAAEAIQAWNVRSIITSHIHDESGEARMIEMLRREDMDHAADMMQDLVDNINVKADWIEKTIADMGGPET